MYITVSVASFKFITWHTPPRPSKIKTLAKRVSPADRRRIAERGERTAVQYYDRPSLAQLRVDLCEHVVSISATLALRSCHPDIVSSQKAWPEAMRGGAEDVKIVAVWTSRIACWVRLSWCWKIASCHEETLRRHYTLDFARALAGCCKSSAWRSSSNVYWSIRLHSAYKTTWWHIDAPNDNANIFGSLFHG